MSLAQAQAELRTIAGALEREYPAFDAGWNARAVPLAEQVVGKARPVLLLLAGAMGFILLIGCANVGNLYLGRALARSAETAVRVALGASRRRLVRQWLAESLLLSIIGGAASLALAGLAIRWLVGTGIREIPRLSEVGMNLRVFGFALGVTSVAGLVFGLAPLLVVGDADLRRPLTGHALPSGRRGMARFREALVVSQVALSLVLLAGAGLLLRSLARLHDVNPGFDAERVLAVRVDLPSTSYPPAQQTLFFDELVTRVRGLPGVRSVGAIAWPPIFGFAAGTVFRDLDRPEPPAGQWPVTELNVVDTGYFRTMRIPLIRGRGFGAADARGAVPVVVVNRTLARMVWGDADPIGRRLRVEWTNPETPIQVIGEVGDVHQGALDTDIRPMTYFPQAQNPLSSMNLIVRAAGNPAALLAPIRGVIQEMDPQLPVQETTTMEDLLRDSTAGRRYPMFLLALLAVLAATLAAVGVYGVLAYLVRQRVREIGIRMALGASRGTIAQLVLRRAAIVVGIGITLGLLGAAGTTRFMRSLLFEVRATDPVVFGLGAALLVFVAVLAAWLPARAATRIDPLIALRTDL